MLEPRIDGDNMQAVLAMFRGETSLAEAPEQVFATTTPPVAARPPPADAGTAPADRPRRRRRRPPPERAPAENTFGIVPPRDVTC